MRTVVPLKYGTVFKKAFSDPEVFTAFVNAALGEELRFTRVEQEHSFHPPIGNVNVRFDLFAEDDSRRVIVELQHVREEDTFSRFHHYHLVAQVEQVSNASTYASPRTVYTVVVLTRLPRDLQLRFDVAVQVSDLVTRGGQALGVLQHRLVVVNPRGLQPDTPAPLRRWLELLEDTLDEVVDEDRYQEPLLRRVLDQISQQRLSADENAALLDERGWERARAEERDEGRDEGRREATRTGILDLVVTFGLHLDDAQKGELDAADLPRLDQIRRALLDTRRWP